jgi:hypothetical protein
MIQLTDQQKDAVRKGEAVFVEASGLGEDVVILSMSQFRHIQEMLDDQREQGAVLRYSQQQAAEVARENPY